jgi:hypothetical protein
VIPGFHDAREDVTHLRIVVYEGQQRFARGTALADTENVLGRRIESDNQQVIVKKNNAGAERINNIDRAAANAAVIVGTGFAARAGRV